MNPGTKPSEADDVLVNVPWSPSTEASSFQILSKAALFRRLGPRLWERPEQLQFDLVIHCTGGAGTHMVDFDNVPVRPDTVIHVRPGQIHQWQPDSEYDGNLILIRNFRRSLDDLWSYRTTALSLSAEQREKLNLIHRLYQRDWAPANANNANNPDLASDALRDLTQATLGIPVVESTDRPPSTGAYFALRADIEQYLDHSETIKSRAARLGYATKTLDRACREATGKTAKRLQDERIALEARRLLVLPGLQASAVARNLGFAESTNFTKFIKRMTGRLPTELQQESSPFDQR